MQDCDWIVRIGIRCKVRILCWDWIVRIEVRILCRIVKD